MPRNPDTHVGVVLLVDGTQIACDALAGPVALSGLKVTWGRTDKITQPPASTCEFQLADDGALATARYFTLVQHNSTVEVYAVDPGGERYMVFGGRVSDLTLENDGWDSVVTVTAIDPSPLLSIVMLADTPWPQQSARARREAILAAATTAGAALSWPTLPDRYYMDDFIVRALDVDNRSVMDVISEFAWAVAAPVWPVAVDPDTTGLVQIDQHGWQLFDRRDSRWAPVGYFASNVSGESLPVVALDACDIDLEGTEFTSDMADGPQPVKVAYNDGEDRTRIVRPQEGYDPTRMLEITSQAPTYAQATQVGIAWRGILTEWRYDFSAPWVVGALVVDPDTVTVMEDFHLAMRRLLDQAYRIEHIVLLQRLPEWTPWRARNAEATVKPNVTGQVEGGTYEFLDGRWLLTLNVSVEAGLSGPLAPDPYEIEVRPGAAVDVNHDDPHVVPFPTSNWAWYQYATFADGQYRWNGTAWVPYTRLVTVRPGDVEAFAHDDPTVQPYPSPTSAWAAGQYATFADGAYRWDGTAWVAYTPAPVPVAPGDSTTLEAGDAALVPTPTTPWTAGQYATFAGDPYRWDGSAWAAVSLVSPGETVTTPHSDLGTGPDPQGRWDVDDYATFSDGRYRWTGEAWAAYVIWTVGRTNLVTNPKPSGTWGWRVSNAETMEAVTDGGAPALELVDPVGGGLLYVDPSVAFTPELGQWIAVGYDLRALDAETAANMRLRINGYTGTTLEGGNEARPITTTGYTRATVAARVTAYDPAGRVRPLAWPNPAAQAPGNGFRLRRAVVAIAATEADALAAVATGWDGDNPDTEAADYAWTGTADRSRSTQRVPGVVPGSTVDVSRRDTAVKPNPTTAWATDAYATFSDGTYRWNGTGWVLYVAPIVVQPGDVVDVAWNAPGVVADPTTAWPWPQYATFAGGVTRYWTGTTWFRVYLLGPGDTTTLDHDDRAVIPDPMTAWGADEFLTAADGDWHWDGSAWVDVTPIAEPWPGETVRAAHDDPRIVTPGVPVRWPWDNYPTATLAMFTDGMFGWRSSSANPQGYWSRAYSVSASVSAPKWAPVAHDDPLVTAPTASANGAVALFTDGPYEAADGAWTPTDRIGYDGATVPYTHDDPTVVAIPQTAWPWDPSESRGRPVPYVTFTDGEYRWSGTAWVPTG